MAASVGKRYVAPSGAEVIVTKGGPGDLSDGEVELLVIKPGVCDLRYNGAPMEVLQPKVLPSAD